MYAKSNTLRQKFHMCSTAVKVKLFTAYFSNVAKSNTLRQKFHMCSTAVKVKLFTAYFSNVYMCALWVNYRKITFHQFMVAYNNSYRILNRLPMRCSASGMFATDNVNSCTCVIRKSIFSLMTRIALSLNPIVKSIVGGGGRCVLYVGPP